MHCISALACALLATVVQATAHNDSSRAAELFARFERDMSELPTSAWSYDYREYFKEIPSRAAVTHRRDILENYKRELSSISRTVLTDPVRTDWDHLHYIVDFELHRAGLELRYIEAGRPAVGESGIAHIADAGEWYALFVQRFTTAQLTPDELYAFGLREITQSHQEIESIRQALGSDSSSFYSGASDSDFLLADTGSILRGYRDIQTTVYSNLPKLFYAAPIEPPAIAEIPSAGPQSPPAYYDPATEQGTFYFNFYGGKHDRRSMPFLYLHEAVPGHHYHFSIEKTLDERPAFARSAFYPGYFEGWAAYTELLGDSLLVYSDLYSRLGRWKWDLVRSVRICLDVGIHAKGWSQKQALAFWNEHIPDMGDIAAREIQRCTMWPAQVLSYKIGEVAIERLRDQMHEQEGSLFDIRRFHAFVLEHGQLPLPVLVLRMDERLHSNSQTTQPH